MDGEYFSEECALLVDDDDGLRDMRDDIVDLVLNHLEPACPNIFGESDDNQVSGVCFLADCLLWVAGDCLNVVIEEVVECAFGFGAPHDSFRDIGAAAVAAILKKDTREMCIQEHGELSGVLKGVLLVICVTNGDKYVFYHSIFLLRTSLCMSL